MEDFDKAKILLYPDGSVHFCVQNTYCTFYATAAGVLRFLGDPSGFLRTIEGERESTQLVNPKRRPLEMLPGITLVAYSDKGKLSINFPEIVSFAVPVAQNDELKDQAINLEALILENHFSTSKGFLLKYYLEFVRSFDFGTIIKNELDIPEDELLSIFREIYNSVFAIEPAKKKRKSLDDRLNDIKHEQLFLTPSQYNRNGKIPVSEYAALNDVPRDDVHNAIKRGKIKTAEQDEEGKYWISLNEPMPFMKRMEQKTKAPITDESKIHLGTPETWSAGEVEKFIAKNRLFSPLVGRYIYSKQELDYYLKAGFLEVEWKKSAHETKRCLVKKVDVDFRTEDGVSNRDRMKNGEPPVEWDPNELVFRPWELHHLGQRDSVYVTLPHHIHVGPGYKRIFHSSAPNDDLHGPEFDSDRRMFWKWYIQQFDNVRKFEDFPHVYPLKSKNKVRDNDG